MTTLEELRNDKDFEEKLKLLCNAYDEKYGRYPESSLEGGAIFSFYQGKSNWDEYVKDLGRKLEGEVIL